MNSGVVDYPHDRSRTPIARMAESSTFAAPGSTFTSRPPPVLIPSPLCIQGKPTGVLRLCKRVMSPSGSDADRSRDRCRRCGTVSAIEADGGSRPVASRPGPTPVPSPIRTPSCVRSVTSTGTSWPSSSSRPRPRHRSSANRRGGKRRYSAFRSNIPVEKYRSPLSQKTVTTSGHSV